MAAADLQHFLQRRELLAYEQRLARAVYAYGVDLRRAMWLHGSTIGDAAMRGVDRRWNEATKQLAEFLEPPGHAPPTPLLEELARLIRLLRAPLPTLRVLRPEHSGAWPIVTPLGTTKGGVHWLILDAERLTEATPSERAFALGWGLGHLQCDHGPIFAAHWMAHHRGRGVGFVRTLLRHWSSVATFSADRAGMLATNSLEEALEGLPICDSPNLEWLPRAPSLDARRQALEDFDRSTVMIRLRLLAEAGHSDWLVGPPRNAASGGVTERLSHVFGAAARLGARASWIASGGSMPQPDAEPEGETSDAASGPEPEEGEAGTKDGETGDQNEEPPARPEDDPELEARLELALRDAWSVARCDQRLTRRLKLL